METRTYLFRPTPVRPIQGDELIAIVVDVLASVKDDPEHGLLTPLTFKASNDRHGPMVLVRLQAQPGWDAAAVPYMIDAKISCRPAPSKLALP